MGKIYKSFIVVLVLDLFIPAFLLAQGDDTGSLRSATVEGYAYLQDQSDHSGVAVIFTSESAAAVTDTFYSNNAGFFTAGLSEGLYSLKYEKEHYVTIEMPDVILVDIDMAFENVTLQGPYMELSGEVSGTLNSTYKYLVIDDITVPSGDSLLINGGVEIYFSSGLKLDIYGLLKTQVTGNDTVLFSSIETDPQIGDWEGIYIHSANSTFDLCKIEYAGSPIVLDYASNFQLSNTLIEHFNEYAISCTHGSQIEIINNIINNHSDLLTTAYVPRRGIYLSSTSNVLIQSNTITNLSSSYYCDGIYMGGTGW